jgi:hypothetical protein
LGNMSSKKGTVPFLHRLTGPFGRGTLHLLEKLDYTQSFFPVLLYPPA